MRTHYILPLLALALAAGAQAQTVPVSLTDAGGNQVNGQVLHVNGELNGDLNQTLQQALLTTNITSDTRSINVKRYEMDVIPGTQNYFCWTLCYPAEEAGDRDIWVAHEPVLLAPGQSFDGFFGDYMPMGIEGTSTFRFVWYDMDSPNDSTSVDVVFDVVSVGISEVLAVRELSVFPNPSLGGDITIAYDLAPVSAQLQLAVYNLLGERQLVKVLTTRQGRLVINSDELGNGVWIAALEANGKTLATKRLVVAR